MSCCRCRARPPPHGSGIARAVVEEIELGVVRADVPGRRRRRTSSSRPSRSRCPARPGPGTVWCATPPCPWPVEADDGAARAVLAAAEAGDHEALDHGGRRGDDGALRVVDDLGLPQLLAGLGVERHHVRVEAADEDLAVVVGHTAVVDVAAGELVDALGHLGRIAPAHLARLRVDGEHVLGPERGRDEQRVADEDGRGFLRAQRAELQRPRHLEVLDVTGGHLCGSCCNAYCRCRRRRPASFAQARARPGPARPAAAKERRGFMVCVSWGYASSAQRSVEERTGCTGQA